MDISALALATAFGAGAVSFLSPCVLPIVPGYISYLTGQSALQTMSTQAPPRPVPLSMMFVAGFTTIFVLLGAGATELGQLIGSYRYEAGIVGGAIILVFGIFMTGLFRPLFAETERRFFPIMSQAGPGQAYVLGLAFGFGWTPCIGPVLGSILTVTTSTGSASGIILLSAYALGLGLPFVLASVFLDRLNEAIPGLVRWGKIIQFASGLVMIAVGLAMVTGTLPVMAGWLIDAFPAFVRIG